MNSLLLNFPVFIFRTESASLQLTHFLSLWYTSVCRILRQYTVYNICTVSIYGIRIRITILGEAAD